MAQSFTQYEKALVWFSSSGDGGGPLKGVGVINGVRGNRLNAFLGFVPALHHALLFNQTK